MNRTTVRFLIGLWLCFAVAWVPACRTSSPPGTGQGGALVVFHAGSLAWPVKALSEAFQEKYPGVSIRAEASGSREAIRKVTELGREADVVLSADVRLIDEMMVPGFARWSIAFARNEMVVAYTPRSRYADEVSPENWYQVLQREGVLCGYSDPRTDPAGYRARMVWQLAERYYAIPGLASTLDRRCSGEFVRPKSVELVALLQSGNLDYAFLYRSVALQNGLPFLSLPPEINLCCPEHASLYEQAVVKFQEPHGTVVLSGEPILYGVTIPENAPHPDLATEFVRFLLGPEARALLEKMGQPPVSPPVVHGRENLPSPLRALFP